MIIAYVGRHRFTHVNRSDERESFTGWNRQHHFSVYRDEPGQDWDIDVCGQDGRRTYWGTWRDSGSKTIEQAIFEAMRGSELEVLE